MKVKTSIADHHADAGGHREPEHGGGGGGGDEVLQYSFEVTSLASYGQMVYKKCKKKIVCAGWLCAFKDLDGLSPITCLGWVFFGSEVNILGQKLYIWMSHHSLAVLRQWIWHLKP